MGLPTHAQDYVRLEIAEGRNRADVEAVMTALLKTCHVTPSLAALVVSRQVAAAWRSCMRSAIQVAASNGFRACTVALVTQEATSADRTEILALTKRAGLRWMTFEKESEAALWLSWKM